MGKFQHCAAALVVATLALCLGVTHGAVPEATVCFFGFVNPAGYSYVSYLQPRFPHVKFNPVVVGWDNSSVPYERRRDRLRTQLTEKKCAVVIDSGGNWNYTLYRSLRAEPGMPLWVESKWGKSSYQTIEEPEKYPALRLWPVASDQTVTAINTALALNWKDVVIVSTNKTGDNVTLAQMKEQAKDAGLTVRAVYVQGDDEGLDTVDDLITKVAADSPTRAVLPATSQTDIVQALVDSPRGLVPIVSLDKKTDYRIRASLGVLAPQELELKEPHQWKDHWRNFTNMTELWDLWQVTEPSSWSKYYFRNTTSIYMDDVEVVVVALAALDAFYNSSKWSASAGVPPAWRIHEAARGLEVELFTRLIVIANHTGATFAPPRSLEVVLTQPPKQSIYYQWKVIANFSDGKFWRTEEELQWPAVGKMKGIVEPLFPVPYVPPPTTNWALISVMAVLGLLLIVTAVVVAVYFAARWAKLRHCPKKTEEAFTAFFVSTHNEDEIRDLYGYKTHDVFAAVRSIVATAASKHNCFIARRLEAHYLLVAKKPEDAVKCAAAVVTNVAALTAISPPKPKAAIRKANTGTPSLRSGAYTQGASVTVNSDTKSERSMRSARSRAMTSGIAASQARSSGITPHIAVGMAHAFGRIEFEDGAYAYGGEPVDIAASIADFAVHNQILATQELIAALPQEGAVAASFDEYCEREFGRGSCAQNYELLEFTADGCPRADPEKAEAAREGKNETAGGVGALSAALQASCGGLVTRSVAVVAVHIPELGMRSTDAAAVARMQDAYDLVCSATSDFKGMFAALHDGWCIVTVNGTGGVAQAPMRATSLAVAAVDNLRDAGFAATAGVATGPTIAGGINGDMAAARHMTGGGNAERARLLALGAGANDAAVLVSDGVKREAESSFEFAACDFIAARAPHAPPVAKPGVSELGMPDFGHPTKKTAVEGTGGIDVTPFRTVKVFSVIAASSAGDVEDEWMYQLAAAGSGPCVRINAAFELIGEGSVAEAQSKLSEAAAASALVDSPEMAAIDTEGQMAMKAAVLRGEALCTVLTGSARDGDDHQARLSKYAVDRTAVFMLRSL